MGAFQDQADSLCWGGGLGYGNNWCQRLTGPQLTYGGTGEVSLGMKYFNDSEATFDYTKVLCGGRRCADASEWSGIHRRLGTPPAGPWAYYARTISQSELGGPGERPFRIGFEFTADGGWSDEDGQYNTAYGPFAVDDVNLGGDVVEGAQSFDFESGLQGWTAERCPGIGSFFAIHPVSGYVIQDPCECRLSGNVAAFHDANGQHPVGQLEAIYSPPVDHTNYLTYNRIFADWDQYSDLPMANGVFYRPLVSLLPLDLPDHRPADLGSDDGEHDLLLRWRLPGLLPRPPLRHRLGSSRLLQLCPLHLRALQLL